MFYIIAMTYQHQAISDILKRYGGSSNTLGGNI